MNVETVLLVHIFVEILEYHSVLDKIKNINIYIFLQQCCIKLSDSKDICTYYKVLIIFQINAVL